MGLLTKLIPPQYKLLVYAGILAVISAFCVYRGYQWAAGNYQVKIDALELERDTYLAERDTLANQVEIAINNVKEVIVTKYVDRVKVIKEKETVYVEQANNNVPSNCELSAGWVYLHDASARNQDADSTRSSDASPSGVTDNQALAVVTGNYSAANANAEQLKALQEYVREAEKIVAEANEVIKNSNKKGWGK